MRRNTGFAFVGLLALPAAFPGPLRAADADAQKSKDLAVQAALEDFQKAPKTSDAEKVEAVQVLARLKDRRLLDALVRLLGDPHPLTRMEAAKALSAYEKEPLAAQALVRTIRASGKEPDVQIACFKALGRIRDWGAAPAVIDFFNDNDRAVARAAIEAAGEIRHPSFVPELIQVLDERKRGRAGRFSKAGEEAAGARRLHAEAQQALEAITGESKRGAEDWESWWKLYGARVTERLAREDREARERAKRDEDSGK